MVTTARHAKVRREGNPGDGSRPTLALNRATETLSHREKQKTLCLCDAVACWNDR
jgi:hypothetical protein